jgi:hypothetical protein
MAGCTRAGFFDCTKHLNWSQASRMVRMLGRFHIAELNGIFALGGSLGN